MHDNSKIPKDWAPSTKYPKGELLQLDHPLAHLQDEQIERLVDYLCYANHRSVRALHVFACHDPEGRQAWRVGLTAEACRQMARMTTDQVHARLTSRVSLFECVDEGAHAQAFASEEAAAPPDDPFGRFAMACLRELHDAQLELRQGCQVSGHPLTPLLVGGGQEVGLFESLSQAGLARFVRCSRPLFRPRPLLHELLCENDPLIRLGRVNTALLQQGQELPGCSPRSPGRGQPVSYSDRQREAACYLRAGSTIKVTVNIAGLSPTEVRRIARQEKIRLRGGLRGNLATAMRSRRAALFCESFLATVRAVEHTLDQLEEAAGAGGSIATMDIVHLASALYVRARAEIGALLDAAGEQAAAHFQDPNMWVTIFQSYLFHGVDLVNCRSCGNDLFLPKDQPRTFCYYCKKALGEM